MSSGFPAVATHQLAGNCAEFSISRDQESWIGDHPDHEVNHHRAIPSVIGIDCDAPQLYPLWSPTAKIWSSEDFNVDLSCLYPGMDMCFSFWIFSVDSFVVHFEVHF